MERIGRYELRGELGRGAAGVVYRAIDSELARPVAIKLFMRTGPAGERRFQREGAALARLDHECVLRVHACGAFAYSNDLEELDRKVAALCPECLVALGER